ncbi:MAG: hypothetical protein M9924_00290 [Rhizobiaceae bacterium]|nr:hypothetical protein [Rhizobiaceae bacterium]
MRANSTSWPIALLLCGAAGFGYMAADSRVVSGAGGAAVRLIKGGEIRGGEIRGARAACNIKGNVSINTGERIYHVPGQKYYEATIIRPEYGERYFCSEQEARRAGWRRSKI